MYNKKLNLNLFGTTGVFPVHNNIFKIGTLGRSSGSGDMKTVKDLETFSPSIDANTEEWTPMDLEGWMRRAVTGKGLTFSFSGKRNYGDPGNDYIAGLLLETGQDVETKFEWTLPNGDVFTMNCVINLTTPAGGDSTNIDTLEFELMSDGLPVYTTLASQLARLTFVCTAGAVSGTRVQSVSPILTGGNSYYYKINGTLPAYGIDITAGLGWQTYALGADIPTTLGNNIAIVEVVTASKLTRKGGIAPSVL